MERTKCARCGQTGHWAATCKNEPDERAKKRIGIVLFCTTYSNPQVHFATEDTLQALEDTPPPAPSSTDFFCGVVVVGGSFHRLSGAGPSGLKLLHLHPALVEELCDDVINHLTALVQLLARGQAPRTVAPFLAVATLSALPKKDGSIRPIAIGETPRRLVALQRLPRESFNTAVPITNRGCPTLRHRGRSPNCPSAVCLQRQQRQQGLLENRL